MWKKISVSILLLITAGILFVVSAEYYSLYTHRRLSSIEVLKIGSDRCPVTLPLKPADAMHDPTVKDRKSVV